jgi:transcriptional regulator NrdR family protein
MKDVKEEGGTVMYCPKCKRVEECRSIALETNDKQRHSRINESYQWYRRTRQCLGCKKRFQTAEIDENDLIGLVEAEERLWEFMGNRNLFV